MLHLARGRLSAPCWCRAVTLSARKQWLADHLQLSGQLVLDAGAIKALAEGKSLLPVGVVDVWRIRARRRRCCLFAGRSGNRSRPQQLRQQRRAASPATAVPRSEALLGYADEPEIIHRDNLILR